ncbi:MAG TPA: gephyrin-like molybdotransferase Glp [Armatimonadota bacterium]|nr:gephyrin-like molybdotransferase Glp [Armatimonadota bacterium]
MQTWGELLSADEARRRFAEAWEPSFPAEEIATPEALGRVLARGVAAPEDLPPFRRSLMDGFACRSADIAGAPARLRLVAEVHMGEVTRAEVGPGEAARIPTGGMLPEGADVVVPIEQAEAGEGWVEIRAALAAGRHLIERGEDVRAGEPLLAEGHRLRPADVGALMGLGLIRVSVYRLPRVGILSTGDEVVPADQAPPFGKIRDMNSYALAAHVQALGGLPKRWGIVPDDAETLFAAAREALAESDLLLLNGGTSVGPKDVVAAVIDRLGKPGVLVHGVDIRPGKPTVFALCDGKPVFGLPGQPVSALNTFDRFVAPVLRRMLKLPAEVPAVRARLTEPLRSADGREDHVRVLLEPGADGWRATPIAGVSAMITTMIRAQGITVVPARSTGFERGEEVEVRLL